MSKQLSIASAASILALSAFALFAPGSARLSGPEMETGTMINITAPAFSVEMPLAD